MLNKLLKKHLKNEEGLTLIELLVVIVILGIIAAIAVVSIGGIVKETKDKAKVSEAVQIINAAKLAHTTEGSAVATSWDKAGLSKYLSNTNDADWVVKYNTADKSYSIEKHDGGKIVNNKTEDTAATEAQLTSYLNSQQ